MDVGHDRVLKRENIKCESTLLTLTKSKDSNNCLCVRASECCRGGKITGKVHLLRTETLAVYYSRAPT